MSTLSANNPFRIVKESRKDRKSSDWSGEITIPDMEHYPTCALFMTKIPPDVAASTKRAAITFFVQEGRLTACVTLPASGAKCFLTLEGFETAFQDVEQHLQGTSVVWTVDHGQNGKNGK